MQRVSASSHAALRSLTLTRRATRPRRSWSRATGACSGARCSSSLQASTRYAVARPRTSCLTMYRCAGGADPRASLIAPRRSRMTRRPVRPTCRPKRPMRRLRRRARLRSGARPAPRDAYAPARPTLQRRGRHITSCRRRANVLPLNRASGQQRPAWRRAARMSWNPGAPDACVVEGGAWCHMGPLMGAGKGDLSRKRHAIGGQGTWPLRNETRAVERLGCDFA